jgi:hypothetical protein
VLRDAEHVRRGLAHGEQVAEVRGEFVDAIEVEIEFDEAGEGGLIERIGGDGAEERPARLLVGVDVGQAVGDREKIFGAEIRLVEEVGEIEAGSVGVAGAVVGDRLQATKERDIAGVPVGVFAQEIADGIERSLIVARNDQGFDDEEGVGFPRKAVGLGVIVEAAGKRDIAGVGRKVGEGEERRRVGREIAKQGGGFMRDTIVVAGTVVGTEQLDARTRKGRVGNLEGKAQTTRLVVQVVVGEMRGEFGVDFSVVGKFGDESAELKEGELVVAAFPTDFRG